MAEPSKTYEVINNRVYGWIDGLDAMRQAVEKVLSTERFEYTIYTDNYGTELVDLIGTSFQYAESDVERRIKEALSVDDRIVEVTDFTLTKTSNDSFFVKFNVTTIYGKFDVKKEVAINE